MKYTCVIVSYKVEIIEAEDESALLSGLGTTINTMPECCDSYKYFDESGNRIGGGFGCGNAPFEVHWSDSFKPKTNEPSGS